MSDPASVSAIDRCYIEAMGRAALDLQSRPRWKFGVVQGDRACFHDRTPRPVLDLKIIRKENEP